MNALHIAFLWDAFTNSRLCLKILVHVHIELQELLVRDFPADHDPLQRRRFGLSLDVPRECRFLPWVPSPIHSFSIMKTCRPVKNLSRICGIPPANPGLKRLFSPKLKQRFLPSSPSMGYTASMNPVSPTATDAPVFLYCVKGKEEKPMLETMFETNLLKEDYVFDVPLFTSPAAIHPLPFLGRPPRRAAMKDSAGAPGKPLERCRLKQLLIPILRRIGYTGTMERTAGASPAAHS